jgi:hypothetical protein
VLGRPIAYVGITPEQAEQGMKARSMPDWLVGHDARFRRAVISVSAYSSNIAANYGNRQA